jgi:dipeptidyl aminopeptidase/acylaminoacyl peptidase
VARILFGLLSVTFAGLGFAAEAGSSERLVHRFLQIAPSPNGALVAAVEGDSPASGFYPPLRELVIRPMRGGSPVTVALPCGHVPQCWPGSPAWTSDSRHLTFSLRTPGGHRYGIYSVMADGSGLTRLIDFNGTIETLRYGPKDRLALLATENARKEVGATEAGAPIAGDLDAAPPEQRIAILENGTLHWASPPDLFVYEYDWMPKGEGFVGTAAQGDGDNNWWIAKLYVFGIDSAPRVLYRQADARQQIALPRISRDGRRVAFIGGIMSDFGSTGGDVFTVPLAGGSATNITPGMKASAESVEWGCSGHLLARVLASDKTQFVDLGSARQATASPQVLWSGSDTLEDNDEGNSLACPSGITALSHETFEAPPEIEVGTLGHWHNLTNVNAGLTMPLRVQSITWKSEGFDVQGWLLLPKEAQGKMPMVTLVHGGPAAAARPAFSGPGLSQTLLAHGYAIFRPNPRGSYGQGERFAQANVRDLGHGDLRDVLAGIDAAEKAAPIDDARLGLSGGSYGGFMTMWAVTQTHRFKGAVAAAGISDWLSYYGENGIDGWLSPYFGPSPYEDPAVYAQSSAINFIRNVRTPTFEYVGELDIECPAPQTQEFWHALKSLGVPTEVMIYPGEGHGLRDPENSADAVKRTVEWFDRYLK